MKIVRRASFLMIVLLVSMCFLIMQVPLALAADVTVLRFAGSHPIGHHCTRGMELYAKLVHERTSKVKIEVYPASQLMSDKDLVRGLPSGAVEMGVMHTGAASGLMPSILFVDLPFFYKDRAHWHRVIDSKAGDAIKPDFEKKGMQFLYWMDYGRLDYASKVPLKTLEDFKGKRIRAPGEMQVEGLRAMGAAPTFMGNAEVYLALQRNTIDGAVSGTTSFWERKYFEVTKYLTNAEYQFGVFTVLMNKKIWDGLPKDVQSIMLEAGKEAQAWGRKECEMEDDECLENLKKKGMQYYYVPDTERERWRAATTKVCIDVYTKRVGDPEKCKLILDMAEKTR
jgi:tripartite ATP-independent transporter DctP family solute receptor